MRILQVISNVAPRQGGPAKIVLEMSAALAAQGHTVDVVTTSLAHRGSWIRRISPPDLLPVGTGRRLSPDGYYITFCRPSWPTVWGTSFEMAKVLREMIPQADIIHIHSLYLFHTLLASRLAKAVGVPYVIRPHGTLDPYIRRRHRTLKAIYNTFVEDRTLRHAAAIHFTSADERDLASPALPKGIKTAVIPLGVDVTDFRDLPDRDASRKSLGIDPDALVWLFLGRLNHKKGLDLLAPAFVQFCRDFPKGWMIVAGPDDGGLGRKFLRECSESGLGQRVTLPGFVAGYGLKQLLAAADLWILPSYSENFGVAVVEAMAAGLPVLITDRVNIWRTVESSGAGIAVAPEQHAVLAGMRRLATLSSRERVAMGGRGKELCQEQYSWDTVASMLTALYSELVAGRKRGDERG
jgi:glycosyltransferase involved in cell wall biosynthesis